MPCYQGQLQLQGKSQRIESGWWDGHDVQRDYYRAINPAGRKCWIYRDRQSGNWFLQGFFD
jgi:protein ImuB